MYRVTDEDLEPQVRIAIQRDEADTLCSPLDRQVLETVALARIADSLDVIVSLLGGRGRDN